MSVASVKLLTQALQENDTWVRTISLASCELTDEAVAVLGTYFHKKQVESLHIGGNRFTFKAMAKFLDELAVSAESGRLLTLNISNTLVERDEGRKKSVFLDSLCSLIRRARLLKSLDISEI